MVTRRGPSGGEPAGGAAARPPAPATAFVGRERELATVREWLRREDARLVVLTGPGGVGKTRVGLEAVGQGADFPDGVVFVPLAGIASARLVIPAIAAALGLRGAPRGRSRKARWFRTGRRFRPAPRHSRLAERSDLVDHLRARRLLLFLDGFEHLLKAAPAVGRLLADCPRLKVLATSRAGLRLGGENEVPVGPLPLPDRGAVAAVAAAGRDGTAAGGAAVGPEDGGIARRAATAALTRLNRNDAVRLYVDRARAAAPAFVLDVGNAGAVAELCRRLDGLPLAIELAAARTRVLPPAALLAGLRRRLPLLASGPRDAPPHQQTLRRTIAWSYGLLDAPRRVLFRRLAVFRGSFGLEAATAVAGGIGAAAGGATAGGAAAVVDALEALLDESLLLQAPGVAGEPRFRLLETVREFAGERLAAAGEAAAVRRRHAHYCLALAEAAAPAVERAAQGVWFDRLAAAGDDLWAAVGWLVAHGEGERALRLVVALWPFCRARGPRAEARDWLRRLLDREGTAVAADLHAAALACAGDLAWLESDFGAARSLLERSVALVSRAGTPGGRAAALFRLGLIARTQGDLARARETAAESLRLARAAGDAERTAWALGLLATVSGLQGDVDTAHGFLEETGSRYRDLGAPAGLAWTRFARGQLALQLEDGCQAAAHFEPALAAFRTVGDAGGTAAALLGLGHAARLQADLGRAQRLLRRSVDRFHELGERHNLAPGLAALGRVAEGQGDPAAARAYYLESLAVARPLGAPPAAAPALEGLAALEAAEGRPERAARFLGAAVALRPETEGATPIAVLGRRERAACADRLRARLGGPAFAAAWRLGRERPLTETITQALDSGAVARARPAAPVPGEAGALSAREREVAALIAHGLTNRQLAERLFITPGTAANHVVHILNKLGLNGRSQIAAWAVGNGLAQSPPAVPGTAA
jgi:predicted ATPase/DNA-binding CsgD family transcriptional regulator